VTRQNFIQKNLINRSILSYLLYPASLVYAGYMFFRRRVLHPIPYQADFTVISVGNLTIGGSGKSPIAIALLKALKLRGFKVAYASRGYKSALENGAYLLYDGKKFLFPIDKAGDEAVMAARSLGNVPVFCGKRRSDVLRIARDLDLDLMVLDDAFQHLKVHRDLDLVVFDTQIALGNGFVIPAGFLREGLSALTPKCVSILHQKPHEAPNPMLEERLRKRHQRIFHAQSQNSTITHQGKEIDPESLKGQSIALVSAIAQPQSFEKSVREKGISFSAHHIFPDHHHFSDPQTIELLKQESARYLMCTAKDAPKLESAYGDRLLVLGLDSTLDDELIDLVMEVTRG